jgi:hypothetical protein
MTIVPDDKDWTWILTRQCPECGFDAVSLPRADIAALVRSTATQWLAILDTPSAILRQRARSDRWSPLEYACHVRDVFRIYDQRLQLMLTTIEPTYPNWDQDRSAIDDGYHDQDPGTVGAELAAAASLLATHFDTVVGPDWERRGIRSDGARFTVDTFGRYMIHDPVHHLYDVHLDLPGPTEQDESGRS